MTDLLWVRDPTRPTRFERAQSLVERTRLDARFESSTGRVLRVLAPGGYGKSTLVARWADRDTRPVRWLDLERLDNDPLVLAAALEQCLTSLADAPEPALRRDHEFSGIRRSLTGAMRNAPPFVLVLDDVHHLDTVDSIDLVATLAEDLPPQSTLVLAGRSFRRWATARLRLAPGIDDITTEDLAFDLGETEQMLRLFGMDPDLDVVARLHLHFGGWPAGLRLAALTNTAHVPDAAAWTDLDHLPHVMEYVAQEWFEQIDPDDRELLTCAASLGRFNAEMCDLILDRTDSEAALRRLVADDAIILGDDQPGGWFRMYPVVSQALRDHLRTHDRSLWRSIHLEAAAWWTAAGDIDLAIEHAGLAGDIAECERLVIAHAPSYTARGMNRTVMRWLEQFDDQHLLATPDLCFMAAIVAVQAGASARAAQLVRMFPDLIATQSRDVEVRGQSLRAAMAICPAAESVEAIEPIIELIPAGPWRATVRWTLGANLFLIGDDRARDVLRTAAAEAELTGMLVLGPNIQATIAAIELIGGSGDGATERARTAISGIAEQRAESIATTGIASAAAALAEARAGRHDLARGAVEHARHHLDSLRHVSPWLNIIGRLAIARACLLLDDPGQGGEVLDVVTSLRDGEERIDVDTRIEQLRSELDAALTVRDRGAPSLTDAELRVLRYLPTNLSLAEVARRLYVSRNTVKSHVAAIYRKFGATTRGGAVDLAKQAGVLDPGPSWWDS